MTRTTSGAAFAAANAAMGKGVDGASTGHVLRTDCVGLRGAIGVAQVASILLLVALIGAVVRVADKSARRPRCFGRPETIGASPRP